MLPPTQAAKLQTIPRGSDAGVILVIIGFGLLKGAYTVISAYHQVLIILLISTQIPIIQ